MHVSPVLVGRADEAAALRTAYEHARSLRPATLLISGEAGIGKSRLVTAATLALAGDPLLLSGGCLELGAAGAPYVPFVAITRSLVRQLGRDRVMAMLPQGGSALGDWLPDLGPAPARYGRTRLLEEMLVLVSRVAAERPVVLVVEDLHWADASSSELFAYLARNLTRAAVVLVGTVRTGELGAGHPTQQLLAELGRRDDVTRIELSPLTRLDVAELLAAINGQPPTPDRSERIHRRSGGNPLFVEALSTAGEAAPDDLRALLLARIDDLPGRAREALSALAVAGAVLTDQMLCEAGAIPGPRLHQALTDLVGRDLVIAGPDGYAIRHDLIREVVYDSVLPGQRQRIHARYAATLGDRDPDSLALAGHWTAAGETGRALSAAWHAAERAARQNAYDEQLHLLELILAQWTQVEDPAALTGASRLTVLERAAEAAFAAGRPAAGIAHSTAALADLDPAAEPQRVARLLGLRGQLRNRVDGAGWDDLERAETLVPPGASDALRSSLLSALGFIGIAAHRHDDSRRHAAEALCIAERLDDDGLRAPALLVLAALHDVAGELEPARRTFAEARRIAGTIGDEHTFLTTFQWEAGVLEGAGQYEQAAELARAGQQAAGRLGRARSRGCMLASARAIALHQLGRWAEASAVLEEALAVNPPPLYTAFLNVMAAEIARCRGETTRFEILLRQLTEFARNANAAAEAKTEIAIQRISWAAEQGDPELADRILGENLHAAPFAWLPQEGLRLLVAGARAQRARRAAAPRNREIAGQVTARFAQLSRMIDAGPATPATAAYRLTFQALAAPEQLPAWDKAAAAWRDLGNRHETALALAEGAAAALASNNRPGARLRLGEARSIAAGLGAEPLLARIGELAARGRLADGTGTPVRNDFGLTPRELDVLRVLVRGWSNPQIAEELFITVNTVATHVARILAKLDAATRTEAAARARENYLLDDLPVPSSSSWRRHP